jgi:hypothetical protein
MKNTLSGTFRALFLALGILQPVSTANLPQMGSAFLPMHIRSAVRLHLRLALRPHVGFVTPLLRMGGGHAADDHGQPDGL